MEKSFSFSFQFATDSYDIAFGLFFEWNKDADETEVSYSKCHMKKNRTRTNRAHPY